MSDGAAARIPTVVLGGSGYVAGELLRLLAVHPALRVIGALSGSRGGEPIAAAFPHLARCYAGLAFAGAEELPRLLAEVAGTAGAAGSRRLAIFSAAPHGAAAAAIDQALAAAERAGFAARAVDLSADFRYPTAAEYAAVYGPTHGAPHRLAEFVSALPEHLDGTPRLHVGHPGCFTTAVTLLTVPLLALRLVEPELAICAITGSTGAGRTPTGTTHHPERRSTLFAYGALGHRHEPEMRRLARAATGVTPEIAFVPHAGPFARGIHVTLTARLAQPADAGAVRAALARFYADAPFVSVIEEPPKLQAVVGSNRAELAIAVRDRTLVGFATIDNLVKGAAGGGIQWMNRLLGLPETAGLEQPGLGWL